MSFKRVLKLVFSAPVSDKNQRPFFDGDAVRQQKMVLGCATPIEWQSTSNTRRPCRTGNSSILMGYYMFNRKEKEAPLPKPKRVEPRTYGVERASARRAVAAVSEFTERQTPAVYSQWTFSDGSARTGPTSPPASITISSDLFF